MYLVKIETIRGEKIIRKCESYREALCIATNYTKVKTSKILKSEQTINHFDF